MFDPFTASAIALKTTLLLVAVGLIALLMARQSAAWRHFLWASALALSLLMPIAVAYLPSYVQVSLPWQMAESLPLAGDEPAPVTSGVRRVDAEPDVLDAREPNILDARDNTPSTAERQRTSSGESQAGAAWPTTMREAWPIALLIWLIGALVVLLRNALAHVGLIRWVRKARPDLSPAWAATLRQVTSETGFRRRLRVLESDHTTSPCTWGLVRPVLLLPAIGAEWPELQRRFTLLHELAHVRRCDYLTTQIASFACAMHWYNPLVWFAATQARKLQEQACDDAVLRSGGTPSDYAQFLVSIAAGSQRLSLASPAAVGMVWRSQLHGRVTAILDASRARLPLSGLALLVALAPLACLMIFLATVSAVASPVATQPESPSTIALQPEIPLTSSFSSVELRNGGTVNLIHGQSQRVTLLKGDPESIGITIGDDGRLVIDRCPKRCQHRHALEVEVVTPALTAVAIAEGGTIQSRGDFPYQPQIEVAVSQGGIIDIRSMAAASVTASVYSGGRIFLKALTDLSAKVEQGGLITYWGDATVTSSVRNAAGVSKGNPADADKLLAEFFPEHASVPAVPVVPAVPAVQPAVQPISL